MLVELAVDNFTIIDKLQLSLASGMTALTGETGAGKSIMIDALLLALGGRAEAKLIRTGTDRCQINACFDTRDNVQVTHWLQENDLEDSDEVILRRVINSDGRSTAYINGQRCPVQQLREIGRLLVNIHGQHEHQSLLRSEHQRRMLDAYAAHHDLLDATKQAALHWQQIQKQIETIEQKYKAAAADSELLQYQVNELQELGLAPDELANLEKEHTQLARAEELIACCQQALQGLDSDNESSSLTSINHLLQLFANKRDLEPRLTNTYDLLEQASVNLQEASDEITTYLDQLDIDPERLAWIETRLSAIHDIARKHKVKPVELSELETTLTEKLSDFLDSDSQLKQLHIERDAAIEAYFATAEKLRKSREKAAKRLSKAVTERIQKLGMPQAEFLVEVGEATQVVSTHGTERIEFLVRTNPGQSMQPLTKVASGGELSRISLAIQSLTAEKMATPTLIFDEVDTGVGGSTAAIIGQLLHELSAHTQVLCVTHLPQVAAQADQHLQVEKHSDNQQTFTHITALHDEDKVAEIARMLGGLEITEQTLAHARELINSSA